MKDSLYVFEILKNNNIGQSELSKFLGIKSRQAVNNWGRSKKGIPKQYLLKVVEFINSNTDAKITIEELLKK